MRGVGERVLIDAEAPFDARPQHFHSDKLQAVLGLHLRAMHLRDRGRRHGIAERDIDLIDRSPEGALDREHSLSL